MADVIVTLTPINLVTMALDDSQPTLTLITNPTPSLVVELGEILRGPRGIDGISHAVTIINTDSSRPIAYCGYRLASDSTERIDRLDYTNGQQPSITRASVASVVGSWGDRTTLIYT